MTTYRKPIAIGQSFKHISEDTGRERFYSVDMSGGKFLIHQNGTKKGAREVKRDNDGRFFTFNGLKVYVKEAI